MDQKNKDGIRNLIIAVLLAWIVVQAIFHRGDKIEWRDAEIEYLKQTGRLEAEASRANAEVAKANAFIQRWNSQMMLQSQRQVADKDTTTTETVVQDSEIDD